MHKDLANAGAKSVAAAHALLDIANETLLQEEAGARLRVQLGLHWSVLTCIQYLSGKQAVGALTAPGARMGAQAQTTRISIRDKNFSYLKSPDR